MSAEASNVAQQRQLAAKSSPQPHNDKKAKDTSPDGSPKPRIRDAMIYKPTIGSTLQLCSSTAAHRMRHLCEARLERCLSPVGQLFAHQLSLQTFKVVVKHRFSWDFTDGCRA